MTNAGEKRLYQRVYARKVRSTPEGRQKYNTYQKLHMRKLRKAMALAAVYGSAR